MALFVNYIFFYFSTVHTNLKGLLRFRKSLINKKGF